MPNPINTMRVQSLTTSPVLFELSPSGRRNRIQNGAASRKPEAAIQRAPYLSTSMPTYGEEKDGITVARKSKPAAVGPKSKISSACSGSVDSKAVIDNATTNEAKSAANSRGYLRRKMIAGSLEGFCTFSLACSSAVSRNELALNLHQLVYESHTFSQCLFFR